MNDLEILETVVSEAEGNTNPQPNQAKRWCFTWNNYPVNWFETIEKSFDGSNWIVGKEVGANGTPHLQGYIELKKRARWTEFNLPKSIHWERARGTKVANINYCVKDGDVYGTMHYDRPLVVLKEEQLYDWQARIYEFLNKVPDDRTIYWVWETTGGVGKSTFVKFLVTTCGGIVCSGKSADLKYLIVKFRERHGYYPKHIFYDIPRSQENYVSWTGLEEIKNGCFASTKYECEVVVMNSPHIVCFANFEPNYSVMSFDRWNVIAL